MKCLTLKTVCSLLYLLIFVQNVSCKRVLAQKNRLAAGGGRYRKGLHSHWSLCRGKKVLSNRTSSEMSTANADDNKRWFESYNKYLALKPFTGTNNEEEIQFDSRKREDAYRLSKPEEFPYALLLLVELKEGDESTCSGTLITTEWVLTAAHCLYVPDDETDYVWIYAGGNSQDEVIDFLEHNKTLPSTAQLIKSAEFVYHPKFPTLSTSYDIGLVRASEHFKITSTVNTIKLTNKPWQHRGYRSCVTTGFGVVVDERESKDDAHRKTQILDVKKPCVCNFMVRFTSKLDGGDEAAGRLLCAKPKKDFGICSGDSGGGLACEEDGEMKIRGINQQTVGFTDVNYCEIDLVPLLLGLDSETCGDRNIISMFQDPYFHLLWLNKYTNYFSEDEVTHIHIPDGASAGLQMSVWATMVVVYLVKLALV